MSAIWQYPDFQSHSMTSDTETPLVTVDVVIFTILPDANGQNQLHVLLMQRNHPPYEAMWAVPGGFIHKGETLEHAAARYLKDETGVANIYLEQLSTFGAPERDPRARVITVSYFALIRSHELDTSASLKSKTVAWHPLPQLPDLAFDHKTIIEYAVQRLKRRLENSSIAFQLLPEKFTLTELQRVYELILDKELDKRNFRKKILSSGLLDDIGETKMEGFHRPAQLYVFRDKAIDL
ncbi:MAG: NUDIX domain-containing protein [Vampirovibrionales bacterium]|nr:NUDIX domain-containing protein [Vampirovibrionales bacterium]